MSGRYIKGGMGDVLLCLQDALEEEEIDLYSHNLDAPKLLAPYGVRVRFEHFLDHRRVAPPGRELRRRRYPVFPIPEASLARARALPLGRRVVGVHPVGSAFSRLLGERRGTPVKRLPADLVWRLADALDDGDTSVLLFCAPAERADFAGGRNHVRTVAEPDPWDTLACVTRCHGVVAVDSVVKTMSALLRIPTVVLVGRHRDRFRDRHFILPYVRDGVMQVVRFTDPAGIDAARVVSILEHWEARQSLLRRLLAWSSRRSPLTSVDDAPERRARLQPSVSRSERRGPK